MTENRSGLRCSPMRVCSIALTMAEIPKPKLIRDKEVRIQAIKVRSAAAQLRYLANSVLCCQLKVHDITAIILDDVENSYTAADDFGSIFYIARTSRSLQSVCLIVSIFKSSLFIN